jgi:hypothetical protein
MTNTEFTAQDVVKSVQAAIENRIEYVQHEGQSDWVEYESWQEFLRFVRSFATWVRDERTVVISATPPRGSYWSGTLGEILDRGSQGFEMPRGEIIELGSYTDALIW